MRRSRNFVSLVLFVFVAMLLTGCSLGVEKSFLVTQRTFDDMVTDYHVYYKAAPPSEQLDLKENVHPKVIEALGLLAGINEAMRLKIEPSKIDRERFRELRYKLYQKLPKIFEKEG